jgi:Fanconi anemia group M protein
MKQNVLAVLPTGLGKTEIAVLATAHFLLNHWDKKVLVMAPTRPLVAQHYERFLRLLRIRPERARVLTGEIEAAQRMREWMNSEIKLYFATPQTAWLDHERGLRLSDL